MMAPPPPRSLSMLPSWKPLVLEEDEWAQALEAIIERDFFPDIPKMQSKLEWLQVGHPPFTNGTVTYNFLQQKCLTLNINSYIPFNIDVKDMI